jgi:hypothetical protein
LQKVQALEGEAVEEGLILDEFVFRLVNSREGKGQEALHHVAVQAPRFTILSGEMLSQRNCFGVFWRQQGQGNL